MSLEGWITVVIATVWLSLVGCVATGLCDDEGMQNDPVRPRRSEGLCCPALTTLRKLGATLMSALDDALARVTTFVKDVVAQLTAAKATNDTQTGKLAELQAALDVALSDDAADKAAIAALQAEINTLQDSVAAQINAAVDALQAVPAPVEEAVAAENPGVGEPVVTEKSVTDDPVVDGVADVTETVVENSGDKPVE